MSGSPTSAESGVLAIGLGTGRCGTASLARFIRQQPGAFCFHELNPACVRYEGTPQPILNTVREFRAILSGGDNRSLTADLSRAPVARQFDRFLDQRRVRLIADVAVYYLPYVEAILAIDRNVKFVCLKRDKADTVRSWIEKVRITRWKYQKLADYLGAKLTGRRYYTSRNLWVEHDGSRWQPDPVWDKCFPKYPANDLQRAIEMFWDDYYQRAQALKTKLPESFEIFTIDELNLPQGQARLLDFLGLPLAGRVFGLAHVNRSD